MVIHFYAAHADFEIGVLVQHGYPFGFFFLFCVPNVPRQIISTHLEIATIFAEAHGDLPLLDDLLLLHDVVDGFEPVQVLSGTLRAQSENTVCLLLVEILGLGMDTAERVFKLVLAEMMIFSEVELILGDVAFIPATFGISLVEPASILRGAPTIHFLTIVQLETL